MRKIIKGYENYSIDSGGNVYSAKSNRKLKAYVHKGYVGVYLYRGKSRKYMLVHKLVAEAFIPNPNEYKQINHKDEDPLNNCVENLEWCDAKYNNNYGHHRERLSMANRGKNNSFYGKHHSEETKKKMIIAKLGKPSNQRKKIKVGNIVYDSYSAAAKDLGISLTQMSNIINGKRKNTIGLEVC